MLTLELTIYRDVAVDGKLLSSIDDSQCSKRKDELGICFTVLLR